MPSPSPAPSLCPSHPTNAVWDYLASKTTNPKESAVKRDPIGRPYTEDDLAGGPFPKTLIGRPIGHSTQNLFVKDKKTKQLLLVTLMQSKSCDLKKLGAVLGYKELRFAGKDQLEEVLGCKMGCVTALNLFWDKEQNLVKWVVDADLFGLEKICLCAGCEDPLDHSQHNVTTVSLKGDVEGLIGTQKWVEKVIVDVGSEGDYKLVTSEGGGNAGNSTTKNFSESGPGGPEEGRASDMAVKAKKQNAAKKASQGPAGGATAAPAANGANGVPQHFADEWLFTIKPPSETMFAKAFEKLRTA